MKRRGHSYLDSCALNLMPIKKYIKDLGITLKEFADRINLSRPTLDAYIDMYEKGIELPRDRYQIIFDDLFRAKDKKREEFEASLSAFEELLDQDARFGISNLGVEEADTITDLVFQAKKDLSENGWDYYVYVFINKLLSSYRQEEIFRLLAKYFVVLNGLSSVDEISEEEKPCIATMFNAFSSIKNKKYQSHEDYYRNFLMRREELISERNAESEKQQREINKKIQSVIKEASKAGITLSKKEIIMRLLDE